jgi:HEPN domain-containing protein
MSPEVRDWIRKSDDDFHASEQLLRARKHPSHDAVCFHCQQCIEKLLKAALLELGPHKSLSRRHFTHDLPTLLGELSAIVPMWAALREPCKSLSEFAVRFRYPGSDANRSQALAAMAACRSVRNVVRHALLPRDATSPRRRARKAAAQPAVRKTRKQRKPAR